jgi:hypothetical protein
MTETCSCDVLVAGGGSAGIAAAVAAAREGARVILLEKNSYTGGKATASYVGTICGLYYRSEQSEAVYVSEGFAREFAERVRARSKTNPVSNKMGLHFLPYHPLDFKLAGDDLIREEAIQVFFHTTVSGVRMQGHKIEAVEAISYDRALTIRPGAVIDCTGEALVSRLSGNPMIESEEYQASAQVFALDRVEAISEANLGMVLIKEIQQAILAGLLPEVYNRVSIVPGSFREGIAYLKIGIPHAIGNKLNKISLLELSARQMVEQLASFLIQKVPAFQHSRIIDIAPEVGIRTGQRARGKYILTADDVLNTHKYEKSAAKGAWPVEFWDLGKRVQMKFFPYNTYYDIPEDCLIASECTNLFFAGRNISATEEAIASARVIGTCLQTGFSAGTIALRTLSSSR